MRTLKVAVLLLLGLAAAPAALADYQGEVGYLYLDTGNSGVKFGAIYGIVGYAWEPAASYTGSVEFIGGYGVKDDSIAGINIKLDSLLGIGYKGEMELDGDLSWHYRVMFARANVSASAFGVRVSDDGTGTGLQLGLDYQHFTVGYTRFFGDLKDSGAITLGYKF